jgi:site-specific recombinase XerD
LRAYLAVVGRPLRHKSKQNDARRHMDPDAINRAVRKYPSACGFDRGYSAHSMRATFITTALENGAQLKDVQEPPDTTTQAQRSCMIDAATTPGKWRVSS